ncbi:MAG: outer membrane beta-barrel protein [Chitinophagaceae bacterium]
MKKLLLAAFATGLLMTAGAQSDSTKKEQADTIKVGGMVIIKKGDKNNGDNKNVVISSNRKYRSSNVRTNWWIVDLGFANYNDETAYGSAAAQAIAPGIGGKDALELRTGKSVNVNIWVFQQRLNLIKHAVNLKYGLGVELNNYRFDDERVDFQKNPTKIFIDPAYNEVEKNKLAADYVTVPLMLNFNLTPKKEKGFGFSAGVSGGYLYSARQKIKTDDDKEKLRGNFDLRKWKLSYIGELNLGPVKLYGSMAHQSMFEKGLDITPYNVGVRLGGL